MLSIVLGLLVLGPADAAAGPPSTPDPITRTQVPAGRVGMRDSIDAWSAAGRWPAVDSLSGRLIELLERAPVSDSMELSLALRDQANARWRMRRIRDGEALASAERAALVRERFEGRMSVFAGQTRLLAARIASQMVRHAHSADLALGVVRWAEQQAPPESGLVVSGEHLAGMAHQALGRTDAARAAFDRARDWVPAHAADSPQIVPMLSDRAVLLSELGEFDEAEAGLRRALELAGRPSADTDLLENVLSRLSTLQLRMGNLAESVESASRSLAATRARAGAEAVATLFARVRLANRLGEFEDHRGALEERRALLPSLDSTLGSTHPTAINVRLGFAEELLATGERAAAREQLALAREAMRSQLPGRSSNPRFIRFLQARLDRQSGDRVAARESLAVALAAEAGDREGDGASSLLIETFESVFGPEDSLALTRAVGWLDSLADSTRVRHRPVWCDLLTARARAEARVGRRAAAWEHALAAESLAHRRLVDEVRALPDARGLQLMDRFAGSLDAMVAACGAPGTAEVAWDRLLPWRELVRDEIDRRRLRRWQAGDTALVAAHERWAALQRRLARLAVSGAAHPDDAASAARHAEARLAAEDAERRLARIAGVEPASAVWPGLTAVRSALRAGEALVGYAIADRGDGQRELRAFIARSGGGPVRLVSLASVAAVESAVQAWTALLSSPPRVGVRAGESAARRAGERVRHLVWDPIARITGDATTVFVVPTHPVDDLPWLAFPAPGGRYLAEQPTEVRVLTSERHAIAAAPAASSGAGLLAVGDPAFDRTGAATHRAPAREGRTRGWLPGAPCLRQIPRLHALPSARAEAHEVAGQWKDSSEVRVLEGREATEADFKRLAPGRRVLHLATHGVVIGDDCSGAESPGTRGLRGVGGVSPVAQSTGTPKPRARSPEASAPAPAVSPWLGRRVWLALAGANDPEDSGGDEDDGILTAEEVVTLDLRGTDWVVLSACQSGAAEDWAREGVLGMRRAFHLAGARSVIASRWPVADEATREWMVALYAARPRVNSAGAAVRQAARQVLRDRRARGRTTHPFYWASFSATGD